MPAKGRDTNQLPYSEEIILRRRAWAAADIALCLLVLLNQAQDEAEQSNRRAASLDRALHDKMHGRAPKVYRSPVQQAALPIRGQGVPGVARVA